MLDPAKLDGVSRRGAKWAEVVETWRAVDARRRALQAELDGLRSERNQASEAMAKIADKKSADFAARRDQLRELSNRIKDGEVEEKRLETEARDRLMLIPNAPHADVPDGDGETGNVVFRTWGQKPSYGFAPKEHWELGPALGIMDFERAAKISGARFTVLRGAGARLERALLSFMLDVHASRGYTEIWPPAMIRRAAMEGTGQLPKFEDDAFKTIGAPVPAGEPPSEVFFLAPTAEVPVTNLHAGEILDGADLPVRYTAYTACFRAEAGAYGKDTRGMIRQHQFDKVELVKFVKPEDSYAELEGLRDDAEEILRRLGLHYRVVTLCSGDMGFCAAKTYDLEVWLPGQNAYREISSCSNFEDYQARRAGIRFRPAPGEKAKLVHTLNGSGLAIGRTLVAIVEQGQQADGSVLIPEALRPYTGFERIVAAPRTSVSPNLAPPAAPATK
jgi:seryl-tRNA synthetase